MLGKAPPRLRVWLLCLAVFLVVETLIRLALSCQLLAAGAPWPDVLAAWPSGLAMDLATAALLGAPFLAGLHLLRRPLRWRLGRLFAQALLLAFAAVLLFSAWAEWLFWLEFDGRFNGIAVHYLIFPREVIGSLRQSFDLRLILPPVGLAALGLWWCLRRPLVRALTADPLPREGRKALVLAAATFALGLGVAVAGPFAVGNNRQANELAENGLHGLLRAALTNDARYDGFYPGMAEGEALAIARNEVAQDNTRFRCREDERCLNRRVDNPGPLRRPNIVLVLEESFGSVYLQDAGDAWKGRIAPEFQRLAVDGLFFSNVYATGDRTVRALEAVLTAFPPIPGISTSRRAGSDGMNSLPFLLRQEGYDAAFLYGGIKEFDNMGHFWSGIGFDPVLDQRDVADAGFSTIWGVADEYLFSEALRRLDQHAAGAGRPLFLAMLTVSNHRPYTYPAGRVTFDPQARKKQHAAAYADWALGDFIDRARSHAWFDDTLFVVLGDHGPKVSGAAEVPVEAFRVPLLFYAPRLLTPGSVATLGSSMDVAPTLLGLLGWRYESPFFGVDLMRVPANGGRIVMAHNYDVAFGDGRHVAVLTPKGEVKHYLMRLGPYPLEAAPAPDVITARRAIALTQTAHRMFYARRYHDLGQGAAGG